MPGKPPPENQCTSTSRRTGERCEAWAVSDRSVCYHHGGKSPRGIASAQFDHGRYSKSVPARLSSSYEEVLADARRLELADELAVIIARNQELLSSLYSAGESNGLWRRLRDLSRKMEKARCDGDADAADEHLNTLLLAIEHGASDMERWSEIMANVDTQRRLAESERRRRVEEHQVVTAEEVMAVMGAVVAIITRHVRDERTRHAIGFDKEALVSGVEPNGEAKLGGHGGETDKEKRDYEDV
jgi:hypothetical protein